MPKLICQYPWAKLPIGGSFFVPTLDPKRTIQEGLKASYGTGVVPYPPEIGVQNGKFGVRFKRKK